LVNNRKKAFLSRAFRIAALFVMAVFAVGVFAAPVLTPPYTVSVRTDKPSYVGIAQVMISGTVSPTPGPNSAVVVSVLNPNNTTMDFEEDAAYPSTGAFSQITVAGGPISCGGGSPCWTAGKYSVNMTRGGAGGTSTAVTAVQYSPGSGTGTTTSVSCSQVSIAVNAIARCTATVSGASGTISGEKIAFSATGAGAVALPSPATCTISGTSCSMSVRGTTPGSVTIQASYPGDSGNAASSGTASLAVTQGVTSVSVSCTPGAVGLTSTCTAAVSGAAGVISREIIIFAQTGGTGSVSFVLPQSPASCTMAEAPTCSVAVMGDTPGSVTIQASYGGDADDAGSSGTTTFTVAQTVTSTTSSSTVSSMTASTSSSSSGGSGSLVYTSSSSGGSGSLVYILVAAIVVIVVVICVFMWRRRVAGS
jgi:hypothetical protein